MKAVFSIPNRNAPPPAIQKAFLALGRAALDPVADNRDAIIERAIGEDHAVAFALGRAVAPIATTPGTGFATELGQNPVGEFLASLAPLSAAASIIAQGLTVSIGRAPSQAFPARTGAPPAETSWVSEAGPIPVREFAVNDDCTLAPKKQGFIIGISKEVARRASGDAVVRQLIREDAAAAWDAAYFSTSAGDASSHPGMLAGLTALSGYAGGDREAIERDLEALADVVTAEGTGLVFVVNPKRAARIKIRHPDLAREFQFLPSLAVADGTVIAVDPASWVHGFGDDVDLEVGEGAVVHMEDTSPEAISAAGSPNTVAAPVRSYWQTDALAYRMLADIAFAPRRANAVAFLEGATW